MNKEKTNNFKLIRLINPLYMYNRIKTIRSLDELRKRFNDLFILLLKIAQVYLKEVNHGFALEGIKRALEYDGYTKYASSISGDTFMYKKEYEKALLEYNKALEPAKGNKKEESLIYSKIAQIYLEQGKPGIAAEEINKAIQSDRYNGFAHRTLANIYLEKNENEKALEEYKKALELAKGNKGDESVILSKIAQVHLKQGKTDIAIEEINKAIKYDKDNKYAYSILGSIYRHKRQYEAALSEFEKALELSGCDKQYEAGIYNDTARIYFEQGKCSKGITALTSSMELNPQNATTHFLMGKGYSRQDRYEESLNEFIKAMGLTGNNGEAEKNVLYEIIRLVEDANLNNNEKAADIAQKASRLNLINNARALNSLTNELEIAQKVTKLKSKVRKLAVNLTNQCNLDCKMCSVPQTPKQEISKKVKDEIMKLMPYLEKINWLGGEVFLYPDFEDMLDEVIKYPVRQQITTNGLLINERVGAKLVKNNVKLAVSIDGVTKEVYEDIRRGASYELLIQKLNMFNDLRNKINPEYHINMNVVLTRSNYRQIEAFIEFARKYNADFICFILMDENRNNENIFSFNRDEEVLAYVSKALDKARGSCEKYGISFNTNITKALLQNNEVKGNENIHSKPCQNPEINTPDKIKMCQAPWKLLNISMSGLVSPNICCFCQNVVGNLNTQSMDEIWNGYELVKYREQIVSGDIDKVCRLKHIYKEVPFEVLRTLLHKDL